MPFNPLVFVGISVSFPMLEKLALNRVVEYVKEFDMGATEMLKARRRQSDNPLRSSAR